MRILVTGGCGFIGSSLVRKLILNSSNTVLNLDNLSYAGNLENIPDYENYSNFKFANVDIQNIQLLENTIISFQPDGIIHLAAESHVDRSIDGPENFVNTNIIGTFNLLEASRRYLEGLDTLKKSNFRFLHVSTDEVYGDLKIDEPPFNENNSYKPSSPYSASKASSDHLVRAWYKTYQLPVLITNCSNNYGPYQFPEKLIPLIILNALEHRTLPIYGDGSQIRDWLYVEDHTDALFHVFQHGKLGETYNIGGNYERTNLEIVTKICDVLDIYHPIKNSKIKSYSDLITFVSDRAGHDKRYAIDATKINSELNWSPKNTFDNAIKDTVAWYLENQDWCRKVLKKANYLNRQRLGKVS